MIFKHHDDSPGALLTGGDRPRRSFQTPIGGGGPEMADPGGFYRWSHRLSSKLIDLRRDFGGDLDQFLLQMVFVQAEMGRALNRSGASRPLGTGRGAGLNALSIADITSISRETTRRKLKVLANGGFVQRGPDGLHYLSERYGRERFVSDFSPLYLAGQD